jgi:kinesin family protein 3/17
VFPIVESVLEGFNGTIFAYGQTGTGKTFTMSGIPTDPNLRGVIPNSFQHIFDRITTATRPNMVCNTAMQSNVIKTYLVRASFLELYNEEVRDLLGEDPVKKLDLKEHPETGVYVAGLSSYIVKTIPEMEKYMEKGNSNRVVASTNMNSESSRSHSVS